MINELKNKEKKISVIGLGYVGLPLALEFAKQFSVIGFDINEERIEMMKRGEDPSKELEASAFKGADILFTADPADLSQADFHIVAVPTPVDNHKVPNLRPVLSASKTVGKIVKKGDYVIFESTVYPGCTEEDCLPIIEAESGLKLGDFHLGYSPERINPGDKKNTLTSVIKIVSGSSPESLDVVAKVYESIIKAGVHRATSIKVAEAAKIIENTQRDLNISLMNELAIIFDTMNIDTMDVIEAASTKWNFLRFTPGLVGGHCISVDPYYLTYKAQKLGYNPNVILSGRDVNDRMPNFVAKRLSQALIKNGKNPGECKVLVLGITFKENVADIRNSKVADLIKEIQGYYINVHAYDPHASPNEVAHEYNISMSDEISKDYDSIVIAVAHDAFKEYGIEYFKKISKNKPIIFDLKSVLNDHKNDESIVYWSL